MEMSKSHIKVIFCAFIYIHLLLQPVLFINKNKNTCSMPSFPKRRLVLWAAAGLITIFYQLSRMSTNSDIFKHHFGTISQENYILVLKCFPLHLIFKSNIWLLPSC